MAHSQDPNHSGDITVDSNQTPFQSFRTMCAPLHMEPASLTSRPLPLRSSQSQATISTRRERRNLPPPLQSTQSLNPLPSITQTVSYVPAQAQWNRPRLEQSAYPPNLPPEQQSYYRYEHWATDVEWRRPASTTSIPSPSSMYLDVCSPGEQQPFGNYPDYYPTPTARSLSQPGRRSTMRSREIERPSLLRQTTEASAMRQQLLDDSAFRGNADYQLFVEATFGLSPEKPRNAQLCPSLSSFSSSSSNDYFEEASSAPRGREVEGTFYPEISSVAFPSNSYSPPQQQHSYDYVGYQQARESSEPSGYDSFDASTPDEELPNYAQSQAQMEQRARMEAVRRAQELQSRWRQAHY